MRELASPRSRAALLAVALLAGCGADSADTPTRTISTAERQTPAVATDTRQIVIETAESICGEPEWHPQLFADARSSDPVQVSQWYAEGIAPEHRLAAENACLGALLGAINGG